MSRTARWVVAAVLLVLAVGCGVWAWFLAGLPLDDAEKWSGVLAGFAALVFGVPGLVFGVLALHQSPSGGTAGASATKTTASPNLGSRAVNVRGSNPGTIVTGDDNIIGPGPQG